VEEMVVIGLICVFIGVVSFVSKPSLSLISSDMSKQLDYQIKETSFFDYQRGDNQAQDLKYQINQYLSEILIVTLDQVLGGRVPRTNLRQSATH